MIRDLAEARTRLSRLAGRPLEAAEVSREVDKVIRGCLAYDGWCLIGFDPLTGLRTLQLGGRGTGHTAEMARNEAVMADANKYVELAAAPVPVGWLSAEHPAARHSFRLHEVLLPQGFHSEVRVALRDLDGLWGALVLFREDPARPFGPGDTAALVALGEALTGVVRAFPVRPLARRGPPPGAGVVAVTGDDEVVEVGGHAQEWLDDLVPGGDDETGPDDVTRMVLDAAHAVRRDAGPDAASCVRTVGGHWLRVEGGATALGPADVVVVLRPAVVDELLAPLARYRRLTPRELAVLRLVARGLPTKHVARELGLSPLTVDGHLRTVYRKCAVTGRDELLASLR
jgi:DNA-binding CsgD family transcriptional regulator